MIEGNAWCARRLSDSWRARLVCAVLGALSKQGAAAGTVQLWVERMRDAGVRPDTWACNILLKALLQDGDWTGSASLLSAMTNAHTCLLYTSPSPRDS